MGVTSSLPVRPRGFFSADNGADDCAHAGSAGHHSGITALSGVRLSFKPVGCDGNHPAVAQDVGELQADRRTAFDLSGAFNGSNTSANLRSVRALPNGRLGRTAERCEDGSQVWSA
jgi:hypothetical protein